MKAGSGFLKFTCVWTTRINGALLSAFGFFLALYSIPPARTFLENLEWIEKDIQTNVVGLCLVSVAGLLTVLLQKTKKIGRTLESVSSSQYVLLSSTSSDDQLDDVLNHAQVQTKVSAIQNMAANSSERTIDVLGADLSSTRVPILEVLEAKINTGNIADWAVRLFCLSPEYVEDSSNCLREQWNNGSRHNCELITNYVIDKHEKLSELKVNISLTQYAFPPAVHGIRMGDGSTFISISHWNNTNRELGTDSSYYTYINPKDQTPRALELKELFTTWINMAATGTVLIRKNTIITPPMYPGYSTGWRHGSKPTH